MATRIKLTSNFNQMYRDLIDKDETLKDLVAERLTWFRNNPKDTRLRNHKLTKRLEGKWAISITQDIRIIYEWQSKYTVRFLAIGTHAQVYPRSRSGKKRN